MPGTSLEERRPACASCWYPLGPLEPTQATDTPSEWPWPSTASRTSTCTQAKNNKPETGRGATQTSSWGAGICKFKTCLRATMCFQFPCYGKRRKKEKKDIESMDQESLRECSPNNSKWHFLRLILNGQFDIRLSQSLHSIENEWPGKSPELVLYELINLPSAQGQI